MPDVQVFVQEGSDKDIRPVAGDTAIHHSRQKWRFVFVAGGVTRELSG
jgi:hypothetical protein